MCNTSDKNGNKQKFKYDTVYSYKNCMCRFKRSCMPNDNAVYAERGNNKRI